ncbi:MAG TPA: hypothetical protein VFE67_01370 [Rudaea sp.]|jgi:hypothetical protein|nr:hypothetical protein [Rudaea sp.]
MFYWRWFNRPRHPLTRVFLGAIGAVLLVGVLVFGFFALVAFAFIGSIVAIVRAVSRASSGAGSVPHPAGAMDQRVIEGEFVVLRNDAAPLNH